MQTIELTDDTFLMFAVKHYSNSGCRGMKEFYDDLKRFKYIKRLLRRYEKSGVISEQLLLNHIILLNNVFEIATVPMLFFKFEEKYWPQLKTFLVFLNLLPDDYKVEVPLDQTIIFKLRKI